MIRDSEDVLEKLKHYVEIHEDLGIGLSVTMAREAIEEIEYLRQSLVALNARLEKTRRII